MSDQLTSAIARLHDSASQLNAITDQASQYVNAIEEYLNETCRAGVGASAIRHGARQCANAQLQRRNAIAARPTPPPGW